MKKEINYRLIELPDYQYLISKDYNDNEKNPFLLITEFYFEGIQIKKTLGFFSEEHRDECFRDFTESQAIRDINDCSELMK